MSNAQEVLETAVKNQPKRRGCVRGCLIVFLVLALPYYWIGCHTTRLRVSEETTFVLGPMTSDGKRIDYFRALEERIYPPEMKTDDNGFRVFTRLFGHICLRGDDLVALLGDGHTEFHRLQKYEKLGLDPDIPPTLTLPVDYQVVLRGFYEALGEEVPWMEVFRHIDHGMWTLEQFPMLADWIEELDEPLDAIAEASRKPVFAVPLLQSQHSAVSDVPQYSSVTDINITDIFISQNDVLLLRRIARLFSTRATYRIGQGDIDGAIDDKLTMYRLGRLISQNGTPTWYVNGKQVFEGMANSIPINANPEHPLTAQQIRRIFDSLDALPPHPPLAEVYTWQRLTGLGTLQARLRNPRPFFETVGCCDGMRVVITFFCDWNAAFRRMNEIYDAMQEPPPRVAYRAKVEAMQQLRPFSWEFFRQMLTARARGTNLGEIMPVALVEATGDITEATQVTRCASNIHRLALAILLYELEQGTMPDENWVEQIATYLGDNPEQYFSCPANPSPEGKTTYALVRYGDDAPIDANMVLLVELKEPVPFAEAIVSVDELLEQERMGGRHSVGFKFTAYRSGAVLFLPNYMNETELLRLLGREVETETDVHDDNE